MIKNFNKLGIEKMYYDNKGYIWHQKQRQQQQNIQVRLYNKLKSSAQQRKTNVIDNRENVRKFLQTTYLIKN